jgi:hypothetical protein
MNIDEVWRALEAGESGPSPELGVTVRRIDPSSQDSLFAGIRRPSGTRMLLLQMTGPPRPADGALIQSRGFVTAINRFSADPSHLHLSIESAAPSFNAVFGYVASDVAEYVLQRPPSSQAVSSFLSRLDRWKRFFDSASGEGLSEMAAQGLLAELIFLRDFAVSESAAPEDAVLSWAIPEPLSKDFQYRTGAVEVKSSVTREHTRVHITGERQLDDTGFKALYLLAVILERVSAGGFSLPETVDSVRNKLAEGRARGLFEEKLVGYGYLDVHAARYGGRYMLHRMRAFRVREGFPRVPSILPEGVGDLGYTIALSACALYEVDTERLRALVRENRSYDA